LSESPEVRRLMEQEFPGYDPSQMVANPGRRRFLKLMGASMALAGLTLTGCRRWPEEHLAPYSSNPTGAVPGMPDMYATAMELGGVAQGLLVTSWDGRPIKVEGNPTHWSSWTVKGKQGSADAFAQASVLDMYDPQRSRSPVDRTSGAKESSWDEFAAFAGSHFGKLKGNGGGFAILSEATASPSVLDMRKRLLAAFPQAKWYEYEPVTRDAELEGTRQAFGKPLRPIYQLDKAAVVVSLDADLLGTHPAHVRYAADWSERRRSGDKGEMSRVYVAESCFSITGTVADVRLAVDPARIDVLARALAARVGVAGVSGADEKLTDLETKFVDAAAAELKASGGNGVVAVGYAAPVAAHVLAHGINQQIGAFGKVVNLIDDPAGDRPTHVAAIADLAKAMSGGQVNTLLMLGGNPAYDAPVDTDFANALKKVPVSIHLAVYDNETSRLAKWHLPRAHYLEAWGDARSWDGTTGVVQPLIQPLFGGKSVIEVLAMLAGDEVAAGDQIVRRTWREQFIKGGDFEKQFRKALEAGFLEGSESKPVQAQAKVANLPAATPARAQGTFFLKFEHDCHAYDGRFANNGWLQETHDPLTKLVWDNAALISVKDAKDLDVTTGDVIKLEGNGRWMEAAAYVLPGQPVGVISLSLGYGRTAAGSDKEGANLGDHLGFNAYTMRTTTAPWVVGGVKASKTGQTFTLAATHGHHLMDEIGMKGTEARVGKKGDTGVIIREASLEEYRKKPAEMHKKSEASLSLQLFDPLRYNGPHAWGMTVDMNTCIGCNACVVACQAENNIPIVGKDQVLVHREMHWIRIDRYFKGAAEDPNIDVIHQPMLCVHCENAPCEQVCPVAATMHDTEGLNTMVYNRCIGTRYCSNNCPYKVRRFNYFDWHAKPPRDRVGVLWAGMPDTQQREMVDKFKRMQFNPEVTVRMRGVMEKCTYCVQRVSRTKIFKRAKGEEIRDGDVVTACQQACPTQAIVFGDLRDTSAQVNQLQRNPRAYDVLGELNTRPRTRHLAKLRNRPAEFAVGDEREAAEGAEHAKPAAEGQGEKHTDASTQQQQSEVLG
jgi:molybdopterin-containing oxidoreductase family iron-sulfur binding subunit